MKMPAAAIREEICKFRVISFARFMDLALYCPETGYYETKKDIVGRRGDFITSVSAGSLFGELLAFEFAAGLEAGGGGQTSEVGIAEAGAHDGQLAGDILTWLQTNRPALFERVEYVIIEPSPRRQEWQQATLKAFGRRVRWLASLNDPAMHGFNGIIFSNELLDAFPVRRFGWDAMGKEWFEWGVALDGENFCWRKIPGADPGLGEQCPPELAAVLPDGYTVETSPAAGQWWQAAAGRLAAGKLMTIDYGHAAGEMFSPARARGTLRAYRRHQATDDLLADPGGQDLTAHVNFAAIQKAGEAAGLRTERFCTQPQFLTRILQQAAAEKSFAGLDAKRVRQFQTLTHPEHLGRAFRVLVQSRSK
jgi:SAM-dependent MidA family methyltransferase